MPSLNQREKLPLKFYLNPKEDFKKIKMSDQQRIAATTEGVLNFFGVGEKKKEMAKPSFEVDITELSGLLT